MSMASNIMIPAQTRRGAANIIVATNGIRLPRATSGPVLDLDLEAMAEQLRHEGMWSDGRNSRTLLKHDDFRMILTVMKAGARLHRHHARGTVLVQVLSGHVHARVMDESVEAPAGHALSFDPNLEHEIEAVDDSTVLITIGWPRDFGIVHKNPAGRLASLRTIADQIEAAARSEGDTQ